MSKKFMSRYIDHIPLTLYRIQPRLPVTLRDYDTQMKKGRTSYDLKLKDGLVHPMPEKTSFLQPNGMSLRPAGTKLLSIVEQFKGEPTIYHLLCGTKLPAGLCIFHEHTDHYSLQTKKPVSLDEFSATLTEYLSSLPQQTRQQFIEQLQDEDDQDN